METRNAEQLRIANQNYLKANQDKDPSNYLRTMVELSYAYNAVHENDKCKEIYQKALNFYLSDAGKPVDNNSARMLFDALRIFPPDYAKPLFADIFRTIELRTRNSYSAELEGFLLEPFTRPTAPNERRKMLETAISIRKSIRGKNDPSLPSLLRQEAGACESAGDLASAEKYKLDANALENAQDPSQKAAQQFLLAEFYSRHNNFEKADATWHKAIALTCH